MDLPVPVILIGAIGGLLLHGVIGLFVGAVVFATGYRMVGTWIGRAAASPAAVAGDIQEPPATDAPPAPIASPG